MSEVNEGQSIQAAIDVASDGDTITVHEGTYHEQVRVNKKIIVKSDGAIIDGKHVLPLGVEKGKDPISGRTFNWSGLVDITAGGNFIGFDVRNSLGRGIRAFKTDGAIVQDNKVSYSRSSGILVFSAADILFNEVLGSGDYAQYSRDDLQWPMALMLRGAKIRAEGNYVHSNWGEGIGVGRYANVVKVLNNKSENNYALQIYVDHAQNVTISENTCLFDNPEFFRDGIPPESIAVNNELDGPADFLNKNIVVTNNTAIGGKWNFGLWCQKGKWGTSDLYVADNEFRDGIEGSVRITNAVEVAHSNVIIEKNRIFQSTGKIIAGGNVTGVTVRENEINPDEPTEPPPPPDDHQEILERLDTLSLEIARLSVRLQAQEGNLEDLARVQGSQSDRIERHLKE